MVLGAHHTASDFLQFFSELGYLTGDTGIFGSCVCDNSTMEFLSSADADFSKYDLVAAPVLYMVKDGVAESLEAYVQAGGTLITTYISMNGASLRPRIRSWVIATWLHGVL